MNTYLWILLAGAVVIASPWLIKIIRLWWDKLQEELPAYMVGRIRATVGSLGLAGGLWPHQAAEYLGMPGIEQPLKFLAVLCIAVAFAMRAGQKNDEPSKDQP